MPFCPPVQSCFHSLFVFISISYPIYLSVCFPLYLPTCPVDVLFSCLNIFLFPCLGFTPSLCRGPTSAAVLFCRFATSFAYYGLVMDLQKFGVSHFLSVEANYSCNNISLPTCHWKFWSHSIMAVNMMTSVAVTSKGLEH